MSNGIARICTTLTACLLAGTALAQTPPAAGAPAAQAKPASAGEADPQVIVEKMFTLGGNRKGVRASGAKGMCAKGTFTPSAEAASLSKAPHFAKTTPMTVRFSMGGGNPNISDKTKTTRGFALEFEDSSGPMLFYFISAPVFFAKTPAQMLEFVEVRLPGADGKPDAEKIKAFTAANPETTRQAAWINARPVPASFAGVDYWGVQAYTLTNKAGKATIVKLKAVPGAGQLNLSEDELKAKPDNFYGDELKERLAKGPVAFDFVAILGEAGDPTNDSTVMWPEETRKTTKLGTISVTALQDNTVCDGKNSDPVNSLPEGVAGPANDPIFQARAAGYAASRVRRTQ